MPWVSLIVWLVTFLLSKAKGASTTKAALLATGAGLAAYYVADPANPNNLLGFGQDEKAQIGDVGADDGGAAPAGGGGLASTVGGVIKTGISEVGSTVRSWGPAGTLGVAAGTSLLGNSDLSKYVPWIAGGILLLVLLK